MPRARRAAARGRGGRGGRGRRGGPGGRSRRTRHGNINASTPKTTDAEQDLDINTNVKGFFLGTATLESHFQAQNENRSRYAAAICLMSQLSMEISLNARARALIASFGRKDKELVDALLSSRSLFGLPEVLKAIQALDSARQIRTYEKRLKRLETQVGKVKKRTLGKIKSTIDNFTANKPGIGSASGAVCKRIARWVRDYSREDLEFFALHMPTEPWRKLADICHFNPKEDFPNLPWFLPYCFSPEAAPDNSLVKECKVLTADNVNELVATADIPFSHIKQFSQNLTLESKARIASYTKKLDTIIWNYEDLACDEVDVIIKDRLGSGEDVHLPYGKLMERLLTMKLMRGDLPAEVVGQPARNPPSNLPRANAAPFYSHLLQLAQEKLSNLSLPLEAPIIVMGDKSSSMDVAIRTATIISSLLTAITSAQLVFFNDRNHDAPFVPNNVEEVLTMALTVRAEGSTAPAASLYELYSNKRVVKTIIVVTDEEENTCCQDSTMFAPLYKKYHDEVYPARLVFISFLRQQHATGQMVRDLNSLNFHPTQFTLEGQRPDLTKLDTILGTLSTGSESFDRMLEDMMEAINRDGLKATFSEHCSKASPID